MVLHYKQKLLVPDVLMWIDYIEFTNKIPLLPPVAVSHDVSSSIMPSGTDALPMISNTVVISVTVAAGLLLLLCCVTLGGLCLVISNSCR